MSGEMDLRLEVVVVPVTDMDRAKEFYSERCGFNLDVDHQAGDFRVIQLTPPRSACSISLVQGPGAPDMKPGSLKGIQMTTGDLRGVREELASRGVKISEVQAFDAEAGGFSPVEGELETFNAFAFFDDPDGNSWAIQQGPVPE